MATRGGYIRGTAEYLGGTRIRYTWPCGHTRTQDHSKGKITKRIGPAGCAFLARYWSRSQGVNLPPCVTCKGK